MSTKNVALLAVTALAVPLAGERPVESYTLESSAAPGFACCCGNTTPIDQIPTQINSPGTYCVTQNLQGAQGDDGIIVVSSGVTIEFHGNQMFGPTGVGIQAAGNRIHVRNGTMFGWDQAIQAGDGSTLDDMSISGISTLGVELGDRAQVRRCDFRDVGDTALSVGEGSLVQECSAQNVLGTSLAFALGDYSRLESCSVLGADVGLQAGAHVQVDSVRVKDARIGMNIGAYSRVERSNVGGDFVQGILAGEGAWIGHTTVAGGLQNGIMLTGSRGAVEGCQVVDNGGRGIQLLGDESLVRGNVSSGNGLLGLLVTGSRNRVEGNTVDGNGTGIAVLASDNLVIDNRAAGNAGADVDATFPNVVGPTLAGAFWIQGSVPQANFVTPIP